MSVEAQYVHWKLKCFLPFKDTKMCVKYSEITVLSIDVPKRTDGWNKMERSLKPIGGNSLRMNCDVCLFVCIICLVIAPPHAPACIVLTCSNQDLMKQSGSEPNTFTFHHHQILQKMQVFNNPSEFQIGIFTGPYSNKTFV